ncbi:MAG: hypothetical protein RR762_15820 [Glutamicibacter sp.]|uniref:hypothetical protein n=1 Tax=Glutamicibacter sp. TaxID=1931995 RepID=UPI002FC7FA92
MIRSTLFLAIAALGFGAMDASAAEVKVVYKGVVTSSDGAQTSSFAPGQTISLAYILESTAGDIDPDPVSGVYYPDGLKNLQLTIASAGVDAIYESGSVHVYNGSIDYVNFESYPTAQGEIDGLQLRWVNVQFLDLEAGSGGQPVMLTSDALPMSHLAAQISRVTFLTDAGYTTVTFLAEPATTEATCASEGYKGTQLTWCKNICESNLSQASRDTWIHRWINRYRDLPYCAADGAPSAK